MWQHSFIADVTETIQEPAVSGKNESINRLIVDNAVVGIVLIDRNRKWTRINNAFCTMMDYPEAELVALDFSEITHPDDIQEDNEQLDRLAGGDIINYSREKRCVRKDGTSFWVRVHVAGVYDEKGRLTHYVAQVLDIDAERVALAQKDALQQQMQAFLEHVPAYIAMKDAEGCFTLVNGKLGEALNIRPQALIGKPLEALKLDDCTAIQSQVDEDHVLSTGKIIDRELNAPWDPSRKLWITRFPLLDAGGTIIGAGSISTDITQTRELQEEARLQSERLQNVIDGTNAGTWEWNVVTGVIIVNERWAEIIGYTLEELEPTNVEKWKRLIHPDDQRRAKELLQKHFDGDLDAYALEARMQHKEGHWIWVHNRGKVVERLNDGSPLRVAGTHLDITQRKHGEAEILAANKELVKSNVELEQFAYVASHDLQEPLRMVASFTKLLEKNYADKLDDKAREYIYFAVDGAQRMQQLIKDLLSYSRLDRVFVEDIAVDMQAILGHVVRSLQLSIADADAQIDCGTLPVIRGDPDQMQQLVQNLVANAIKYHSEEPVKIVVGVDPRDGENVFFVRDNGIGIDVQYTDRIFDIFQRLHGRSEYSGTGIGLSICKRIVERHGGRIWVESTLGEGATFFFTLGDDHSISADIDQHERGEQRSVA